MELKKNQFICEVNVLGNIGIVVHRPETEFDTVAFFLLNDVIATGAINLSDDSIAKIKELKNETKN